MTAHYVYGLTYADTVLPDTLRGVEDGIVTLVTHDRCAALVSELPDDRELGTRDDLLAHERVLHSLVGAHLPVLPFRFGAAMPGPEAVTGELLAAGQDRLLDDLGRVAGRAELLVKGRYENEVAYREVLTEEPELLRLREQIRGMPEDASYYERIRLGELVAEALSRKQTADGERVVDAMAPYAEAVAARTPSGEEVVDAAFLVERTRLDEFERAIEQLGAEWAGRVRLRMIGPLAPYHFVAALAGQAV